MKHLLNVCLVFIFISQASAQLVFNGGGKLKINGGTAANPAFVVLNNSPVNPIMVSNSTDGIIMEAEFNHLQYNLSTGTNSISVPYMSLVLEQIPLELIPTSAGTGAGNIRFSGISAPVRASGFDNFNYMPSDVTNMGTIGQGNNSAKTIDRFWIIDANGYTVKPGVTLNFTYIDLERVNNGGNTITESLLRAQRFNNNINDWGGYIEYLPTGAINTTLNTVTNVTVSPTDFYRSWTLHDMSFPLPIELISFNATCNHHYINLQWCTASEINNSLFVIEQSFDGANFKTIGSVNGNETTTDKHCYNFQDNSAEQGLIYYRLKQIDQNGSFTYSNLIVIECENIGSTEIKIYPNPNNGTFTIETYEPGIYSIINELGQNIKEISVSANNPFVKETINLSAGIYHLSTMTSQGKMVKKIIVTN